MGAYLKNEIGKKFDGDYDVLWATAKDRDFPNLGRMRGLVASALQGMNSIVSLQEIEEVPLLQISLPVGFEQWDGETTIKVAYTPLTINDVDVTEIYAYDHMGQEYVLDAQTPPDFPVMVVGINERMGFTSLNKLAIDDGGGGGGGGGGGDSSGDYYPYIKEFKATRHPSNYEPWYAGDAEVYWIARFNDYYGGSKIAILPEYHEPLNYDCWVFTWTGWHASLKWKAWEYQIKGAQKEQYSLSGIYFYEYDPLLLDAIMYDPWFDWDCGSIYDYPLIGWALALICALIENTGNFWANDDYIGSVNINLTTSVQQFDGDGVQVKMYYKWYNY